MIRVKKIIRILLFMSIIFFLSCSEKEQEKKELIIFHAGSLTVPFDKIISEFKKENPDVEIVREIAGSRECAKKITDLHKDCDLFASADYMLIDDLLIPKFADWNIKFASNELSIVYNDKSKYANEINAYNWFEILNRKDVLIGRSDPNADPCGYRTVFLFELSEKHYKIKNLFNDLVSKNPENIRPKEVDLLALLETGQIDYIFLYRSVAEQHKLKYLLLPDEINLKNPEYEDLYSSVSMELKGKKPGETNIQKGSSMVYGLTIPKNAPNKELAIKFADFLLKENNGLKILKEDGQPPVVPSKTKHFNKIPNELKKYVLE